MHAESRAKRARHAHVQRVTHSYTLPGHIRYSYTRGRATNTRPRDTYTLHLTHTHELYPTLLPRAHRAVPLSLRLHPGPCRLTAISGAATKRAMSLEVQARVRWARLEVAFA